MTRSNSRKLSDLQHIVSAPNRPVLLFHKDKHSIYWLGSAESSVFRSNTYLVTDGDQGILIDPGGKHLFREIRKNLSGLMPVRQLAGMLLSHQDPDVAASMENWLELKPDLWIFSTPRTHVLLPYYFAGYRGFDVEKEKRFQFNSGNELLFIPSPFLHFPGAVTTLDIRSGYLFSGDVWASLDTDGQFVVDNFPGHAKKMDLFHKDYMASNIAARGYADSLKGYTIQGILPQHGSIIPEKFVKNSLNYLENLECGLDLIYPLIDSFVLDGCDLDAPEKLIDDEKSVEEKNPVPGQECSEAGGSPSAALLQEALDQAARHAAMRDRVIRNLRIAESCLTKKERRLKEAQAIGHLGHWEWNILTDKMMWSDEVFHILGYGVNQVEPTYELFLQRIHPDDRKMLADKREKIKQDKAVLCTTTHRIVRPDGVIRNVYEQAEIKRDKDGNASLVLGVLQDITDFSTITKKLADANALIDTIQRMQSRFIQGRSITEMYNQLLNNLLQLTESSYGFIGDVLVSPEGKPYLLAHTLTNLSWNKECEDLYKEIREKGLEFHNLDNLFGIAITSREPVISNDPLNDPRSKGLPPGHPEIHSLLVVPVIYDIHVVGVINLANRKGGYSEDILEYLSPLRTALAQIIVARQDRQARRATEKILEEEAKIDGLLGIPNRRYFNRYIELQIQNALRGNTPLSVIMIDVDFFKRFNDFYGHQKGDQCLIKLARIMQESLHRSLDIVARYGGEEFFCVLPNTSGNGAMSVAQTIKNSLVQQAIPHNKSLISDVVTVSMGVVTWKPGSRVLPGDLVARADKALYFAKQNGRNCIISQKELEV